MPEQADRREAVEDLIEVLRVFAVETDVFVDVFARTHGLSRSELNAIMWIAEGTTTGHQVTAGELAGRLGLGAPATTALIDRLEHAGHVVRARDQADRRRVTVRMQDRAMQLAGDFFHPLGTRMTDAVADLPTADLERVTRVMHRMVSAVLAARQDAAVRQEGGR